MAKDTKKAASVGDWLGPEQSESGPGAAESATNQEQVGVWRPMAEIGELSAGNLRALTSDDRKVQICVWRVTRRINFETRCWEPVQFWADRATRESIGWEPVGWRYLEPGEAGRAA